MRQATHTVIKTHFCKHITATRRKFKWTKHKMAEKLDMDDRSYSDIEKGEFACSAVTLVLYLVFVLQEEEQITFLLELRRLILKSWEEIA